MQSLFTPQTNPSRMRSWIVLVLVLFPILLIIAASIFFTRVRGITAKAEREVQEFRQRVVNEQYTVIYDAASSVLRRRIDEQKFSTRLAAIHSKMGDCRPSRPRSFFANASPSAASVRLQYKTDCAKGVLQETFTYLIVGDEAQLAQYDASSIFD